MFVVPIKKSESTSLSAASGFNFTYSDEIVLTRKWFDEKRMAVKADLSHGAVSGTLDLCYAISDKSGGTYTTMLAVGGTSIILSGASYGLGQMNNGSYLVPLTFRTASSGSTFQLMGIAPYFKLGYRASKNAVPFVSSLFIG